MFVMFRCEKCNKNCMRMADNPIRVCSECSKNNSQQTKPRVTDSSQGEIPETTSLYVGQNTDKDPLTNPSLDEVSRIDGDQYSPNTNKEKKQ